MWSRIPAVLFLLLSGSGSALAASQLLSSLTLTSPSSTVSEGSLLTVILEMDARNAPGAHPGLFGGAVLIGFDGAFLEYQGDLALAPGLSYFSPPVLSGAGSQQFLGFGFDNGADLGQVASLSFRVIGSAGGETLLSLADQDDFFGTFISYVPTYQPFYPVFNPLQVSIIPLPGAAWLLLSALGLLAGLRRQRAIITRLQA